MFGSSKVTWLAHAFAPFYDAPDAGGPGGADPIEGGDGDTPSGEDLDAAGDPAAGGDPSGDPDDEDDDDPDLTSADPITPDRFARVAKKLQKLNRRDRKFAPLRQRIKDLESRGLSLDDLTTAYTNHAQLNQLIQKNARVRALLYGDAEPADPVAAARKPTGKAAVVDEEEFDETSLPFDANENPTNRYFADLAKQSFELRKYLKQLEGRVNGVDQRDTQRTETAVRTEWGRTLDAAVGQIKLESVRTMLRDAVVGAYEARSRHGKSAAQIVAHYVTRLQKDGLIDSKQAAQATAAAKTATPAPGARTTTATQARIAEQNKSLPRTVAPQGTPAPARQHRESVTEVGKRIRQGLRA